MATSRSIDRDLLLILLQLPFTVTLICIESIKWQLWNFGIVTYHGLWLMIVKISRLLLAISVGREASYLALSCRLVVLSSTARSCLF